MDTKGEMIKMKHQIAKILPVGWNPMKILEIQVQAKDWVPFENDFFQIEEPYKAPLMKNMPVNYRLRLTAKAEVTSKSKPSSSKTPVSKTTTPSEPPKRRRRMIRQSIELKPEEPSNKKSKDEIVELRKRFL